MLPDDLKNAIGAPPLEPLRPEYLRDFISIPQKGGEGYRRLMVGQAATIAGKPHDSAVVEALRLEEDMDEAVRKTTEDYFNGLNEAIENNIRLSLGEATASDMPGLLEQSQNTFDYLTAVRQSPLAQEEAYVATVAPKANTEIDEKTYALAVRNRLAAITDEDDFFDTLTDIGSYFIPFKEAFDIEDINKELENDPLLAPLASDHLETISAKWKSLPTSVRMQLLDPLIAAVQEASGTEWLGTKNNSKVVSYLTTLFGNEGGESLQNQQYLDVALGVTDIIGVKTVKALSKGVAGAVEKVAAERLVDRTVDMLHRSVSAPKIAKAAGDTDSAVTHVLHAVASPESAKRSGTTQQVASLSIFPHATQDWLREVTTGISGDLAKKFNQMISKAQGYARTMGEESELIKFGALTRSEREVAIKNFTKEHLEGGSIHEDYFNEGIHLENLKIIKSDAKGFTYEYTLNNKVDYPYNPALPKDKNPLYETVRGEVKFGINQITGTYSATVNAGTAQSRFISKVLSPAAWSKAGDNGDFNEAVKIAMAASDITAANAANVGKMMLWALEPVKGVKNTKARGRLEEVLQAGDEFINPNTHERGRVFTVDELMSGVHTKGVKLLSDNEIEAYYRTRLLADTFFQQQNKIVRDELELGGFKNVKLLDEDIDAIGKPFENVQQAIQSARTKPGFRALDNANKRTVDLSEAEITAQYDKGNVLVRLRNDFNTKNGREMDLSGEFVEYAFVSKDKVASLPSQVLHYRQGYVPKINKAEFFVKVEHSFIKAGMPGARKSVAKRAFNSKLDAEAFRQEMIEKHVKKHGERSRSKAEAMYQIGDVSELNKGNRLEEAVGSGNGLYTGERAKDDIVFGLNGVDLARVSPLEAFQRNVQHLGKAITRNQVRIGEEKRWLNTVRKEMPEVNVRGFHDTLLPDTPKGRALNTIRRTIDEWNSIPDVDETFFQTLVQKIHDFSLYGIRKGLGFKNKDSIHSLLFLKHASPWQAIKSANMHVMLGTFNPAQIYVQASAAAVALARHSSLTGDASAMRDITRAWQFGMLDNIKDEQGLRKSVKLLIRDGQISADDAETYLAYRKSGYVDSVMNNADTQYLQGNGLGVSMKMLKDAGNISLIFYRGGEMFNRRFSFLRSLDAFKKRTGKKTFSDDDVLEIVKDANESMLELNAANRAWWQGGAGTGTARQILGMSTQFLQVMGKTMELGLKGTSRGGWTLAEKSRILSMQVLLFGAAGVPIFNAAGGAISTWLGMEPDEDRSILINQGMVGAIVSNIIGAEIETANRAALGGQILNTWRDLFMSDEPLVLKAFGVSAVTGSRFFDAMKELRPLIMAPRAGVEDLSVADMREGLRIIGSIPSSGRGLLKAYMMHNQHHILDRRYNRIAERDFNLQTEIGALLGFRPTVEANVRMTQLVNRDFDDLVEEAANTYIKMYHNWIFVHKSDPEYGKRVEHSMQMIEESLNNDGLAHRVRQRVARRMWGWDARTTEDREILKFINNVGLGHITEGAVVDMGILDSRVEQGIIQPLNHKEKTKY
jgi:hypothetical protein